MDGQAGSGWQGTGRESGALNPARGRMQSLSWLVTDFAERVPDVDHALVVSSDGVPMAVSGG
jgi:Roadblock/LC7 domain